MAGMNLRRILVGGIVAGLIVFVCEGIANMFYDEQVTAALTEMGRSMEMSASALGLIILSCILSGVVAIFFYAAVRPRLGPGPRTAVLVVLGLYLGGYIPTLIGYRLMGMFSGLLLLWAIIGLVEMILAVLVGSWIYKEA